MEVRARRLKIGERREGFLSGQEHMCGCQVHVIKRCEDRYRCQVRQKPRGIEVRGCCSQGSMTGKEIGQLVAAYNCTVSILCMVQCLGLERASKA